MTLDEAIAHAKELANETPCGREHQQLADWLTELQNLRATPLCNTAALYSALKALFELYDLGVVGLTAYGQGMPFDMIKNVGDVWLQARYALKAAPRNCDVGSEEDQKNRFHRFCEEGQHTDRACCGGCPIVVEGHREKVGVSCELAWAGMPYKGD